MGKLYVLVGPSGTGKTTQVNLLKKNLGLLEVVSHTTRPKRPGEKEGETYYYIDQAEFDRMVANGEFLETVIYPGTGKCYGTSRKEFEQTAAQGDVIIIAEGHGAKQFLDKVPDTKVIFLLPPTEHELRKRMLKRYLESFAIEPEEDFNDALADGLARLIPDIERRISTIEQECQWLYLAHHKVDPLSVEDIYEQLETIVLEERRWAQEFAESTTKIA